MEKVFLYLDDDVFLANKFRDPEVFYPLIGADKVLEIMKSFDKLVKFTTVEDAQDYVMKNGCPLFISFDNDLQRDLEGIHFAHWLVEKDLDNPGFIPDNFQFFVHSKNETAKKSIYSYLNQYLRVRESKKIQSPKLS